MVSGLGIGLKANVVSLFEFKSCCIPQDSSAEKDLKDRLDKQLNRSNQCDAMAKRTDDKTGK